MANFFQRISSGTKAALHSRIVKGVANTGVRTGSRMGAALGLLGVAKDHPVITTGVIAGLLATGSYSNTANQMRPSGPAVNARNPNDFGATGDLVLAMNNNR